MTRAAERQKPDTGTPLARAMAVAPVHPDNQSLTSIPRVPSRLAETGVSQKPKEFD